MDLVPKTKEIKATGIQAGEVLAGFIGGHGIRTYLVKSDKKWINPLAALASAYIHMKSKNENVKNLMLGTIGYFGIKSLKDLTAVAVNGLDGMDGMDGLKEMLNNIIPSLGDADADILSGDELAAAEQELLGLINGQDQFTPYTELSSSPLSGLGSVSNL